MPAKKKAAKPKQHRRTPAEIVAEQLAGDLQRVLAERDEARKDLAEARRGREAWCHKAVELECRVEDLENQLRMAQATTPSLPVTMVEAPQLAERVPAHTYGLPGDEPLPRPTTRFSREFRG